MDVGMDVGMDLYIFFTSKKQHSILSSTQKNNQTNNSNFPHDLSTVEHDQEKSEEMDDDSSDFSLMSNQSLGDERFLNTFLIR